MASFPILSATLPDALAPTIQHIPILLAIFALIALAARLSITFIAGPKQLRVPSGLATFTRFFYASFLKPHDGDGAITGQQAALESFYKAQVVSLPSHHLYSHLGQCGGTRLLRAVSIRKILSYVIMERVESSRAS